MKKVLLVIIVFLFLLLTSCNIDLNQNKINNTDLKVVYFYGFFEDFINNDYVARILYDYNEISFDVENPSKSLIPGDILHLEYRGDLECQSSYPGRIFLNNELISSKYSYTIVIEIDSNKIIRNNDGFIVAINDYIIKDKFVILDNELNFIELNKYNGDKLYCSLALDKDFKPIMNEIAALFSYNPRK